MTTGLAPITLFSRQYRLVWSQKVQFLVICRIFFGNDRRGRKSLTIDLVGWLKSQFFQLRTTEAGQQKNNWIFLQNHFIKQIVILVFISFGVFIVHDIRNSFDLSRAPSLPHHVFGTVAI